MTDKLRSTHVLATFHRWIPAAVILLALASCTTTIPTTDTTQPEVQLIITGPGIGSIQLSNPPRDLWAAPSGAQYFELQAGARYSFVLTVSDQGGVKLAYLRLDSHFELTDIVPADVVVSTSGLNQTLRLTGSRSDPRTGLIITGSFTSSAVLTSVQFRVLGEDFGGSSGVSNRRLMTVRSFVVSG